MQRTCKVSTEKFFDLLRGFSLRVFSCLEIVRVVFFQLRRHEFSFVDYKPGSLGKSRRPSRRSGGQSPPEAKAVCRHFFTDFDCNFRTIHL